MSLDSRQKKHLRSLGRQMRAGSSIGKAGLSEGAVAAAKYLLEQHELLKVHLPKCSGKERTEIADRLAAASGAELVALVGRMALLYRANENLPENDRVHFA